MKGENMNKYKMCDLIAKVICDVKREYGLRLKTQDYIYIVYGRVIDILSDNELSFTELSLIANLVRKGVQAIEKENN